MDKKIFVACEVELLKRNYDVDGVEKTQHRDVRNVMNSVKSFLNHVNCT